ncbi:MAG: WG repeat-containing protein [Clostridiales bacterium]|nr:WG repeat-containing protein [Clostridiales bacterium]
MNRMLAFLLMIALLLSLPIACAEVEGPIFEADGIYEMTTYESDVFKFTDHANGYGIVSLEGEELCPIQFGYIDWLGSGYFEVVNENGLDTHGVVDRNGTQLIPCKYAAFQVFSEQWIGAILLEPTDDEDGDYGSGFFGGGDQYNITTVDIWYMPEQKAVGTLDRAAFRRARAVNGGEYLLVEDRSDGLTMYNAAFEALDHQFDGFETPEIKYAPDKKLTGNNLVSSITGEDIGADIKGVEDASYAGYRDRKFIVVYAEAAVGFDKARRAALMATDGTLLSGFEFTDVRDVYGDRWAMVSNDDYLYGLYDMLEGKLVVPCEYDELYYDYENGVVFNGYVMVLKDGKYGYVDLEGNVTCPLEYASENVDRVLGCSFTYFDGDAAKLVAADGVVTEFASFGAEEINYPEDSSDGTLLVAKNSEGVYGVVDWHGEAITEYVLDDNLPAIYRDGYMEYNGMIYHIVP